MTTHLQLIIIIIIIIRTVTEDMQSQQVKSVLNKYETFVIHHCTQTLASFIHLLSLQPTFLRSILTIKYQRTPD